MINSSEELAVGQTAPAFELRGGDGVTRTLETLRGTPTVVYFYPKAFTPGCTTEACDFRDSLASLQASGYAVIGISPDPVERLAEFAAAEQLEFPLLSDESADVAKAWGAWGQKTVGGRTFEGVLRSTFVLDEASRVVAVEYNVDPDGHVARLREYLGV